MSRHWKEPYSIAKAYQLEMHDTEGGIILGHYVRKEVSRLVWVGHNEYKTEVERDVLTVLDRAGHVQMNIQPVNKWIYYVYVCRFTFIFFSLTDFPEYIKYYSAKILPTRCLRLPHSNHDMRQRRFNRLPLYLRTNSKRPRVVKALQSALADFQKQASDVAKSDNGTF